MKKCWGGGMAPRILDFCWQINFLTSLFARNGCQRRHPFRKTRS